MSSADIENVLTGNGIKPTANRVLVMKELMRSNHPVSLTDLEQTLAPMDKTSIFRVLELFSEKDIIHEIEGGSRSMKYELCHGEGHHSVSDQHAHFYCEKCDSVYCLDDVAMPEINIPGQYMIKSINFMIKGICPKCNSTLNLPER